MRPSRASASRAPTPPSSAVPTSSVESRRCTSAPARTRSRCSATSFAASLSPAARWGVSGPSIAAQHRAQHLVARTHADRDALRRDPLGVEHDRIDDDGPVVAVQVAEDPALGEDARVPLGHLSADDRLGARGVGLFLAPRERQHARGAVLDRHRGVEQRRDRVRDGEQVARGQPADRLRLGLADVALGEQRPQQRRELHPRGTSGETEQSDPGCIDRGPRRIVEARPGHGRPGPQRLVRRAHGPAERCRRRRPRRPARARAADRRARRGRRRSRPLRSSAVASTSPWARSSSVWPRSSTTRREARPGPLDHAREPNRSDRDPLRPRW